MKKIILAILLTISCACSISFAQTTMLSGGLTNGTGTEVVLNGNMWYQQGNQYIYANLLKGVEPVGGDHNITTPQALDQNGNPLPYMVSNSTESVDMVYDEPLEQEVQDSYNVSWAGQGTIAIIGFLNQNANILACNGAETNSYTCSNAPCNVTPMQGYISGNVLTVTSATDQVNNSSQTCALKVGVPISAMSTISSGTYNNSTGAVSLTLSNNLGVTAGSTVNVTGIQTGLTGPNPLGAVQQLNLTDVTTTSGTGGTTINYTAPTGLCGSSPNSLSCSSGVFNITSGWVEGTQTHLPGKLDWGVTTYIVGSGTSGATCGSSACTGTGNTGTYLINFAQTLGSSSSPINLTEGGLINYIPVQPDVTGTPPDTMELDYQATNSSDYARWPAVVSNTDWPSYINQNLTSTGTMTSYLFRNFVKHTGIKVLRDLGYNQLNSGVAGRFDETRPTWYVGYGPDEMRPNNYLGAVGDSSIGASYNTNNGQNNIIFNWWNTTINDGDNYTIELPPSIIPTSAQMTSLYPDRINWNALPTTMTQNVEYSHVPVTCVGCSGSGAVITNVVIAGNEVYEANMADGNDSLGSGYYAGDEVSITVNDPNYGPQTITGTVPSNALTWQINLSIDGGNTFHPIMPCFGGECEWYPAYSGSGSPQQWLINPNNGNPLPVIMSVNYDAESHMWFFNESQDYSYIPGMINTSPIPLAQIALESGTQPWYVEPTFAANTGSNYSYDVAKTLATDLPSVHPWFEGPNEEWNSTFGQWGFEFMKQYLYQANDGWSLATCSVVPDQEYGKVMSLLGQSVSAAYGGDTSRYDVNVGVQATEGYSQGYGQSNCDHAERLTSWSWINQSSSVPTVANPNAEITYTKTPAYQWATDVDWADYWEPLGDSYNFGNGTGTPGTTQYAYNFATQNLTTQNQALANYINYNDIQSVVVPQAAGWEQWIKACGVFPAGTVTCPQLNKTVNYEGGYSAANSGYIQSIDNYQKITGYTSSGTSSTTFALAPFTPPGSYETGYFTAAYQALSNNVFYGPEYAGFMWGVSIGDKLTWTTAENTQGSATVSGSYPSPIYSNAESVTNVSGDYPLQAQAQGYVSGNVLTVTAMNYNTIYPGMVLEISNGPGYNYSIYYPTVTSQLSGTTGGVGTYQLNQSGPYGASSSIATITIGTPTQLWASYAVNGMPIAFTAVNNNGAVFNASFNGTTMTVNYVSSGTLAVGQVLTDIGQTGSSSEGHMQGYNSGYVTIMSQTSGTTGGAGTYTVSVNINNSFGSISNDTITSGTLLYLQGTVTDASDPQQVVANINSSSVGSLINGTQTVTYPGSAHWVNLLRDWSYQSPAMSSAELPMYAQNLQNNAHNTSYLEIASGNAYWSLTGFDIFGYWPDATSYSTITTSGSNQIVTDGSGLFRVGEVVWGTNIPTVATGASANTVITACTKGPLASATATCGSTAGDTLTLSNAATGTMGASFNGSITGNVLTVNSITSGSIVGNEYICINGSPTSVVLQGLVSGTTNQYYISYTFPEPITNATMQTGYPIFAYNTNDKPVEDFMTWNHLPVVNFPPLSQ